MSLGQGGYETPTTPSRFESGTQSSWLLKGQTRTWALSTRITTSMASRANKKAKPGTVA